MSKVELPEYAYPVTRVKAMKRRLLTKNQYEYLLGYDSLAEVLEFLRTLDYREDFDAFSKKYAGIELLDHGLNANLARTFEKVHSFLPEKLKPFAKLLLMKWDLHNIKTILRAKHENMAKELALSNLVYAGELKETDYKKLLETESLEEALDYLRILEPGQKIYALKDSLSQGLEKIENALDEYFFEQNQKVLEENKKVEGATALKEILDIEVDLAKTVSILRSKLLETQPETSDYPEGLGKLSPSETEKLAEAKDAAECFQLLGETVYEEFVGKNPDIVSYERGVELFLLRKGLALLTKNPLSIAPIIGFLEAKENEVSALRVIGKCKSEGIPKEEILPLVNIPMK